MKTTAKLWIGIGILALLSPLGIILPKCFKSGCAWGEWGLDKFSSLWNAPFPDYALNGRQDKGLCQLSLGYIASAIIGILAIACAVMLLGRFLSKGRTDEKR